MAVIFLLLLDHAENTLHALQKNPFSSPYA